MSKDNTLVTQAARLSVAPMMDWTYGSRIV